MTQELKESIRALLLAHCPNVYYENAPKCASYPYLVYELDCLFSEDRSDYTLEVNVWDRAGDSAEIDNLADAVAAGLDHYSAVCPGCQFRIYRGLRNKVDDPDKTLRRRRLTFDLYAYERG